MPEPLADRVAPQPKTSSRRLFEGRVWDVVEETFELGAAGTLTREVVAHPGAVAILALDDRDQVLLIQQYRHPVGAFEWELPAGLLDVDGEPPHETAVRELHEEVDRTAATWHTLLDYVASPGGSNEAMRVYLARDLTMVPEEERHERTGEERGMPTRWASLEEVRDAVLSSRVHNPTLALGVLATLAARGRGWRDLRPVDAPWPSNPRLRG